MHEECEVYDIYKPDKDDFKKFGVATEMMVLMKWGTQETDVFEEKMPSVELWA